MKKIYFLFFLTLFLVYSESLYPQVNKSSSFITYDNFLIWCRNNLESSSLVVYDISNLENFVLKDSIHLISGGSIIRKDSIFYVASWDSLISYKLSSEGKIKKLKNIYIPQITKIMINSEGIIFTISDQRNEDIAYAILANNGDMQFKDTIRNAGPVFDIYENKFINSDPYNIKFYTFDSVFTLRYTIPQDEYQKLYFSFTHDNKIYYHLYKVFDTYVNKYYYNKNFDISHIENPSPISEFTDRGYYSADFVGNDAYMLFYPRIDTVYPYNQIHPSGLIKLTKVDSTYQTSFIHYEPNLILDEVQVNRERGLIFILYSYFYMSVYDLNGNPIVPTNIKENIISNKKEYALFQNYPNPFNPSTKIVFNVPQAGNVKLAVYNLLGQEVSTLVNEFRTAGTYEINFDASNLTSGSYFYKIEAGQYSSIKKMMLTK
ncbi:MAG: T9SS type A sorting domain-containing protein [Syntrophothermus sp.]